MESMGKKKPRPRRSFTPEFTAEIVELCRRGDRSVGQIAKDFDLTETAARLWVSQAEVDAGDIEPFLLRSDRAYLPPANASGTLLSRARGRSTVGMPARSD
ncbi:transposase [Streptomyces sp. NPDC058695]|uniref:transposase n=1 Tax=Streptomyces sp. NPDC058695 TaxID=3346604 RepID=UPI0036613AC2